MSLIEQTTGLLSIGSRVRESDDELVLSTSLLKQLLTLFSYCHTTRIDDRERVVRITERSLWFLRFRYEYEFDEIAYLDYRFSSIPTAFSLFGERTNQIEKFELSLVLYLDERYVPIARFVGEGSVATGMFGVFQGDSVLDLRGTQQERSLTAVERVAERIGITIGPPVEIATDADGNKWFCSVCKRQSPPWGKRCQYCHGDLVLGADAE